MYPLMMYNYVPLGDAPPGALLTKKVYDKWDNGHDPKNYGPPQTIYFDMDHIIKTNNGVGLAANQIGILRRFFVSPILGKNKLILNPEIISYSSELESFKEGCLSFPGLYIPVTRPKIVDVKFYTVDPLSGEIVPHYGQYLSDYESRVFQHEFDHLEDITIVEKCSRIELELAIKKANKKYNQKYSVARLKELGYKLRT